MQRGPALTPQKKKKKNSKTKSSSVLCLHFSCSTRGTKALNIAVCVCVFFYTRVQRKGLQNGCPTVSVNSRPGFCPLARLCFSFFLSSSSSSLCCCPWCPECLSGGALKHNIPNEMWLVSPCCSISTWWDGRSGERRCKKNTKTAGPPLDELHWLSKSTEGAVQFSPSHWRKEEHTFPRRQRTIVDNYLVKSPGRWHLQHTASGRHTTDIWLSKCNGAIVLMLATEATASSGGKEQFKK